MARERHRGHGWPAPEATVKPYQKTCTTCGDTKTAEHFGPHKATVDKLHYRCLECAETIKARTKANHNRAARAYYQRNKEVVTAATLAWREANPERCREYSKQYYQKTLDYQKDRQRKARRKVRLRKKMAMGQMMFL